MKIERWYRPSCSLGILTIDGFKCFTLELPDLDNQKNISCIPPGEYAYYRRESPHNGHVLELRDVPNRDYIQIHAGNFTRQTQGCILVGDSPKFIDNDSIPDISNSKKTLEKLLTMAGRAGILEIS